MAVTREREDAALTVRTLIDRAATYAEAAGITLADKPAPLYRLLVLSELLSTRISSDIAVAAARELHAAGMGTPERMCAASWQSVVDALGRAHYRRYDESTATRLHDNAVALRQSYGGDLRRLAAESGRDCDHAAALLQQFKGIGPTGASIFLREVQDVWPWVRPYFDARALEGAAKMGLPTDPTELARLCPPGETARVASVLVRSRKAR